jgi:hypothetical protein
MDRATMRWHDPCADVEQTVTIAVGHIDWLHGQCLTLYVIERGYAR